MKGHTMFTYSQSLSAGDKFISYGHTLTVESVTLESGYTDTYVIKTTDGSTFKFPAGTHVTIPES